MEDDSSQSSLSTPRQWALIVLPKCSAFLSVIFSGVTAFLIRRDATKRAKTYHRLVAGMAGISLMSSFWLLALTKWNAPGKNSSNNDDEDAALRSSRACQMQGFFVQWNIASALYVASLAIFFVLTIKYSWRTSSFQTYEWYLHGVPLVWGMVTAVASWALDLFRNNISNSSHSAGCWMAASGDEDNKKQIDVFRWVFFYGPLLLAMAVVAVGCALVWFHLRHIRADCLASLQQQQRQQRAGLDSKSSNFETVNVGAVAPDVVANWFSGNREPVVNTTNTNQAANAATNTDCMAHVHRTEEVARQCFSYAAAFLICWLPSLVIGFVAVAGSIPYGLLLISATIIPLHGALNLIVYLGPNIRRIRRREPNTRWCRAVWLSIREKSPIPSAADAKTANATANAAGLVPIDNSEELTTGNSKDCQNREETDGETKSEDSKCRTLSSGVPPTIAEEQEKPISIVIHSGLQQTVPATYNVSPTRDAPPMPPRRNAPPGPTVSEDSRDVPPMPPRRNVPSDPPEEEEEEDMPPISIVVASSVVATNDSRDAPPLAPRRGTPGPTVSEDSRDVAPMPPPRRVASDELAKGQDAPPSLPPRRGPPSGRNASEESRDTTPVSPRRPVADMSPSRGSEDVRDYQPMSPQRTFSR